MGEVADVLAAGAVVMRNQDKPEVLLVHRPKYDDWSFPKGKLDAGEHVVAAAVREVAEETGLRIRLGPPLPSQRYTVRNGSLRTKDVHYWVGRVVGDDDVSAYAPNQEVDEVRWVSFDKAQGLLTYDYDRQTLDRARALRKRSTPLVVLRHSRAVPRKSWHTDDRDRPLTEAGKFQAEQLVPLLEAYGVRRIVTSSSARCVQTVEPYAEAAGLTIDADDNLSEQGATGPRVRTILERMLETGTPAVLCTHRPVLPLVFESLALEERKLEPGTLLVAHHRRGRVVSLEEHVSSVR